MYGNEATYSLLASLKIIESDIVTLDSITQQEPFCEF